LCDFLFRLLDFCSPARFCNVHSRLVAMHSNVLFPITILHKTNAIASLYICAICAPARPRLIAN
jgi:hypothetical protein